MTKILILILSFLTLSKSFVNAQQCEDYDKSLFHILPDTLPDKINCIDSFGLKQGWWIYYKVYYNSVERPNELAKGNYIDNYTFGQYKNNLKIGDWISVQNIHLIYESRIDNYYYAEDTIMITSDFVENGWNKSTLYFNADSSIIKSTSLPDNEKFPICIECNKKRMIGKECKMTYRNQKIMRFPYDDFHMEFVCSSFLYTIEKKKINRKLDN